LVVTGVGPRSGLGAFLTYTQNVPRPGLRDPGDWSFPEWDGMNHTWSLAVEEQFYLIWPVMVMLAGRRCVAPLAMAVVAGSIAGRGCGLNWFMLPARADGLG
jgi:peptidoglycan/LPS O-acetylase OafA/YrhL